MDKVKDDNSGATKYDRRDEKPRVELIPISAQIKEAEVLTHGAKKYGDHNWRKGMEWTRLIGAALRHIFAWMRGEDMDKESGLPHLAHARCCLGMLIEYQEKGIAAWSMPFLIAQSVLV